LTAGAYYLGLDYGTKKIGVAVGQSLTGGARALATINARDGEPDWTQLNGLIDTWQPVALVVGVPLAADGAATEMSEASRQFGQRLAHRYNLPIHYIDERLTSRAATEELLAEGATVKRQEQQRDQIAARLILQTFFNDNS
jgi:putative Holliday junction resolvase